MSVEYEVICSYDVYSTVTGVIIGSVLLQALTYVNDLGSFLLSVVCCWKDLYFLHTSRKILKTSKS